MSRSLSLKVGLVLAALAFVIAFRVTAEAREGDADPPVAAAPLSPSRSSALEGDVERSAPRAPSVSLVPVAKLPRLHREPRAKVLARRKKAAAERRARERRREATRTAPRSTATPPSRATPAPTATAPAAPVRPSTPSPPKRSGGGYVGKGFDSEG